MQWLTESCPQLQQRIDRADRNVDALLQTARRRRQLVPAAGGMVSTAAAITSTVNRSQCAAAARIASWWPILGR